MSAKERSYHFSLGNSSDGPVGFCARITATSKKEAVERLKEALPEDISVDLDSAAGGKLGVGYIQVYINPDAITAKDIDEVDDE